MRQQAETFRNVPRPEGTAGIRFPVAERVTMEATMTEDITYYAVLGVDRPRERPAGVVRRRRLEDGTKRDEAFTRNLKWERTEYLDRYYILGSTDREHVEITEEEADAFVRRLLEREPNKEQR